MLKQLGFLCGRCAFAGKSDFPQRRNGTPSKEVEIF